MSGLIAVMLLSIACGRNDIPASDSSSISLTPLPSSTPSPTPTKVSPGSAPLVGEGIVSLSGKLNSDKLLPESVSADRSNPGEYVVKLLVTCPDNDQLKYKHLSGFFLAGKSGIVTALHGISGCGKHNGDSYCFDISLVNSKSRTEQHTYPYTCMTIEEADIASDLVHLVSAQLSIDRETVWPKDGLSLILPPGDWPCVSEKQKDVTVLGFPGEAFTIRNPSIKALCTRGLLELLSDITVTPAICISKLASNAANLADLNVINLQGTVLEPGFSGAPVLSEGKVIGVVLGGLEKRRADAWAAPVYLEKWHKADEINTDLETLAFYNSKGPTPDSTSALLNRHVTLTCALYSNPTLSRINPMDPAIQINPGEASDSTISAEVYTPNDDACIVITTKKYGTPENLMLAKKPILKGVDNVDEKVYMIPLTSVPESAYREFCANTAAQEQFTLHAYLYEVENGKCVRPLDTSDDVAHHEFEVNPTTDKWVGSFCEKFDISLH